MFTEILRPVLDRKELNHKINTISDIIPQVREEKRLLELEKEKM